MINLATADSWSNPHRKRRKAYEVENIPFDVGSFQTIRFDVCSIDYARYYLFREIYKYRSDFLLINFCSWFEFYIRFLHGLSI